jgi:hypothetical protein
VLAFVPIGALILSPPAAAGSLNPYLSGFDSNGFAPSTYGTITAKFSVPRLACPASSPQPQEVTTYIASAVTGVGTSVSVSAACSTTGTETIIATAEFKLPGGVTREWQVPSVAVGDSMKAVLSDHSPNPITSRGSLGVSLTDLTTQTGVTQSRDRAAPLQTLQVGEEIGGTTIPQFAPIQFTDLTFQGQPLSSVPGLTKVVALNLNGKPMIQVIGLPASGKSFTDIFRRPGRCCKS